MQESHFLFPFRALVEAFVLYYTVIEVQHDEIRKIPERLYSEEVSSLVSQLGQPLFLSSMDVS